MIDIKYHIASIVAVFLALALGILIGSTIMGDDLLVDQQKKILDRLEEQFTILKDRENHLIEENAYMDEIISSYENYSQALLPFLVKERLADEKLAIVVTGNTDIPSGLINTITIAGAQVVSKTVALSNLSMSEWELQDKLIDYYALADNVDNADINEELRACIARDVGTILLNGENKEEIIDFLHENDLVSFSSEIDAPITGVILLGGTNSPENYFASTFDQNLIEYLTAQGVKVFGVENSKVEYSYMPNYQQNNITTIDNIDLSPGQMALVFAIQGEPGNYGIKVTAQKFMPSLPVQSLGSTGR